jgi:lipopolysaccharide export LptBFGC system permease protein LptF
VTEWFAPSGRILVDGVSLQVVMTKPWGRQINERGQEERIEAGGDVTIPIPPERTDVQRQNIDRPADQLREQIEAATSSAVRNPLRMILHTRYAAALAPLLLVLVAMPIGILVRRGSRLAGLGASLPPLMIYFVCYFVFQGLGDKNRISPYLAAYGPDLFLAAVSSSLLWGIARK